MPIYVYESKSECKECNGQFEILQKLSDPPLTHCPKCNKPCSKVVTAPKYKGMFKFSLSEAKEQGMTVLKRRDKGVYEKL
jgi:putative FmdB family regulatory protein